MEFPGKYKVLKQNRFISNNFEIVPIRHQDRVKIMQWRNEQIYHLRQSEPLTIKKQNTYFEKVIRPLFEMKQPDQILFSFLKNDLCIGYGGLVHINWIDKNAEISFIMDTVLERDFFQKNWSIFLSLIERVAFNELALKKIYTYAFDLRPLLYRVLESSGFAMEARLKDHCFFEEKHIDVLIHSKFRDLEIRNATEEDVWLLFEWSNDSVSRKNSFNSEIIEKKEHEKWFKRKIKDRNSIILIGELKGKPCGVVRFNLEPTRSIVGINVNQAFRGQGLSARLLNLSVVHYFEMNNKPIEAYIKIDNIASIKAFEKAGFRFLRNDEVNTLKCLVYVYERE